jgi:hypothetical protein
MAPTSPRKLRPTKKRWGKPGLCAVVLAAAAESLLALPRVREIDAEVQQWHGREITFTVLDADPRELRGDLRLFRLRVVDGPDDWAFVTAAVPVARAGEFQRTYGSRDGYGRRPLTGIVQAHSSGWFTFCVWGAEALIGGSADQADVRTWTDTAGRTVQAAYLSATDTDLRIRRTSDGQEFTWPLVKLSAADRAWVAQRRAAAEPP